jgi:hypothetical protein
MLEKSAASGTLPAIEQGILKNKLQQIYNTLIHLPFDHNKEAGLQDNKPASANNLKQKDEIKKATGQSKKTEAGGEYLMQLDEQNIKPDIENITKAAGDSETKLKEEVSQKQDVHPGKEILAEKYHRNQKYINELLAQGYLKQDITSLMQSKPIKDIEAAIGINEKFLFIHELFSNDEETYLKTIHILNNSSNFNEAFNYIHSTFNWNIEGEAAQKLLDLVRRRFIVEED